MNRTLTGFYGVGTKQVKEKVVGEDGKIGTEVRTINVRINFPENTTVSRIVCQNLAVRHAKKEKITLEGIHPVFSGENSGRIMVKRTKAQRAKGVWNKYSLATVNK